MTKLGLTAKKRKQGEDAKARGTKPENEGPHVKQEKCRDGIINNGETSNLLVDVETVTLDDKCEDHIDYREEDTNA